MDENIILLQSLQGAVILSDISAEAKEKMVKAIEAGVNAIKFMNDTNLSIESGGNKNDN